MLNAWIEHHTFNVFFNHAVYMRFKLHAFNAWYEKHAFYNPLKSIMLISHALKYFVSKHVKRMFL